MVLCSSHPGRADATRAAWNARRPGGSFFASASLADAALSALGAAGALVVIDAEATEASSWAPLLRHLRRNAPEMPVLVFGPPAGAPWDTLDHRLCELLGVSP